MTASLLFFSACRRIAALVLAAFAGAAVAQAPTPQLANPASQNCVSKGGTLVMEKNPRGDQYSVCMFDDNMQCEEWAMMRGERRTGGIEVTGDVTPAARYCTITGGAYTATAGSNTPAERGNCTFPNGKQCTASAHYGGACARQMAAAETASSGESPAAPRRIQAKFSCADGKSIDATFIDAGSGSVRSSSPTAAR